MKDPKKVSLQRVAIESLMEILDRLFDAGFDYVDLEGLSYDSDEHTDVLKISVKDEYISARNPEDVFDEINYIEEGGDADDDEEEQKFLTRFSAAEWLEHLKSAEEAKNKKNNVRKNDINDFLNYGC